jgi:hypothetical protein
VTHWGSWPPSLPEHSCLSGVAELWASLVSNVPTVWSSGTDGGILFLEGELTYVLASCLVPEEGSSTSISKIISGLQIC